MSELSTSKQPCREDVLLWPNGDWCFRSERPAYKSDDFEVIWYESDRYFEFLIGEESDGGMV